MAGMMQICMIGVLSVLVLGCSAQYQTTIPGCRAPLAINYYNAHRTCSCRANTACPKNRTELATAERASSGDICPEALANVSSPRVKLHGSVSCPGGCNLEDVQLWQADSNGRYSPRSKCSTLISLRSRNVFVAGAPLPGQVTEGAQAKFPSKHIGFLHVLVRTTTGGYISEQFRYPGFPYEETDVVVSKLLVCVNESGHDVAGNALLRELKSRNVTCNFSVDFACVNDNIKRYANYVKAAVALPESSSSDHTGKSPTMKGCPKVKDVARFYGHASLALIVETVDTTRRPCRSPDLPKAANDSLLLQSTYVAYVRDVLKDAHAGRYGNLTADMQVRVGGLVQIQYGGDVACCREMVAGERYLVLGIPLPLVGNSNRAADVGDDWRMYRVWADVVFRSAHAMHTLLEKEL